MRLETPRKSGVILFRVFRERPLPLSSRGATTLDEKRLNYSDLESRNLASGNFFIAAERKKEGRTSEIPRPGHTRSR